MKINLNNKPALILIDFQKAFDDHKIWGGARNNPDAEEVAAKLLKLWREKQLPVFHTQHCSVNPNSPLAEGNPGNDFMEIVKPLAGETIIKKNVNSGFIGTNLKQLLDEKGITNLVIAGLTTDHCVSTTVRMAGNFGYKTWLINDATATFEKVSIGGEIFSAQLMHDTALASINGEFAEVVNFKDAFEK